MRSNIGPVPIAIAAVILIAFIVSLYQSMNSSRVVPSNTPYKGGYNPSAPSGNGQ